MIKYKEDNDLKNLAILVLDWDQNIEELAKKAGVTRAALTVAVNQVRRDRGDNTSRIVQTSYNSAYVNTARKAKAAANNAKQDINTVLATSPKHKSALFTNIFDCDVSARLLNILRREDCHTVADLAAYTEKEAYEFRGAGYVAVKEMSKLLERFELTFGTRLLPFSSANPTEEYPNEQDSAILKVSATDYGFNVHIESDKTAVSVKLSAKEALRVVAAIVNHLCK